jgi:hypothetical protein
MTTSTGSTIASSTSCVPRSERANRRTKSEALSALATVVDACLDFTCGLLRFASLVEHGLRELRVDGAAAEFGRFFYTYQTLAKATRTGARYLTTETANGKKDPAAENLVVYGNEAGTGKPVVSGLSPSQVQITRTGGTSAIPERVTVKIVGYTYSPVFDLGKLVGKKSLSLSIDVSPSTTMRYFSSIPS